MVTNVNNQQVTILDKVGEIAITENSDKFERFIKDYWKYYLMLEEEFMGTFKYVEFDKDNFKAYSLEYLKLFQAVCSEIDVVGKALASEIVETANRGTFKTKDATIQKWWFLIQDSYKNDGEGEKSLLSERIVRMHEKCDFVPWKHFEVERCKSVTTKNGNSSTKEYFRLKQDSSGKTSSSTPSWWNAYNDVKHQRTTAIKSSTRTNFTKANLWNLSNAVSALYILEWSYINEIGTEIDISSIDRSALFDEHPKTLHWAEHK